MKTIVVEAKGKKITGTVADESKVELATAFEIDNAIKTGINEIVDILTGEMDDPTKKRCRRCMKLGRVGFYPVDEFSLLANGKRHSQCKVCRVEQSTDWHKKNEPRRKAYQKLYQARRGRRVATPKAEIAAVSVTFEATEPKLNATEALFVGFPTVVDIAETN